MYKNYILWVLYFWFLHRQAFEAVRRNNATIITVMYVVTTVTDVGNNIQEPISKKGFSATCKLCSTLHNLSSTLGSSLWWFYSSLESNQLEDMVLAFMESFDTQVKLKPGMFCSSVNQCNAFIPTLT